MSENYRDSAQYLALVLAEALENATTPQTYDPDRRAWRPFTGGEVAKAKRFLAREDIHREHREVASKAEDAQWRRAHRTAERAARNRRTVTDTTRLSSASLGMAKVAAAPKAPVFLSRVCVTGPCVVCSTDVIAGHGSSEIVDEADTRLGVYHDTCRSGLNTILTLLARS